MDSLSASPTLSNVDADTRPLKKARYDEPASSPAPPTDDGCDDAEYLYGKTETPTSPSVRDALAEAERQNDALPKNLIPGLQLMKSTSNASEYSSRLSHASPAFEDKVAKNHSNPSSIPPAPGYSEDSDIQYSPSSASAEILVTSESAQVEHGSSSPQASDHKNTTNTDSGYNEFVEASNANKGIEEAEWQFNSSDTDSSSSSSPKSSDPESSDNESGQKTNKTEILSNPNNLEEDEDDDDDDGDDQYELLDPEEQARILMKEEGGSDGEGQSKGSSSRPPRTTNEKAEEKVPKPDITITPNMNTPELGVAEGVIENYLLIRGTLSGETRVLESGSVLCLENKAVIGVVAEPLGRVEAPLYSVAFSNADELKSFGIEPGVKVYYVEDHSTYVFTQPLKLMKGSDASNLHDEEVGDDEREFSDDEAEQEFKRKRKMDKLAKKGVLSKPKNPALNTPANHSTVDAPNSTQYPSDPINYDEDDADGMYKPLPRPSNLLDQPLPPKPTFQRGHMRGSAARGQGQRNPRNHRGGQHRKQSRGDGPLPGLGRVNHRHKDHIQPPSIGGPYDHSAQYHPEMTEYRSQNQPVQNLGYQPALYHPNSQTSPISPGSAHNNFWAPNQNFNHTGSQFPQPIPSNDFPYGSPISPGSNIPAGAYVNPAFFRNPQWQQPISPSFQQMPHNQQASGAKLPHWPRPQEDLSRSGPYSSNEEYDPTRPWIHQ